jgi:hypothetical protein
MVGKKRVILAVTLVLVGVVILGAPALAGNTMLTAQLSGASEVPGPGDDNGTGQADLRTIPKREKVCYDITVQDVEQVTMAHIHKGSATEAGPIFKTLKAPTDGSSSGCVKMSRKQIMMINRNPSGFYVNVHSQSRPNGAVRGQLVPSP